MRLPAEPALPTPDPDALAHSARVVASVRDEIAAAGGFVSFARYMQQVLYAPGSDITWPARASSARPATS